MGCPHCDLLLRKVEAPPGTSILCPRCGFRLSRNNLRSLDKTLALSSTGLLLYLPAILMPLITLQKLGMSEKASVIDTIVKLFSDGYIFVSFMVLLSAVVLPLCLLGLIFTVSLRLKTGVGSPALARLFRRYVHLEEWAMLEVYLLGILVTVFKMAGSTDIVYDRGFYLFMALVFVTLGITVVLDKSLFWRMLDVPLAIASDPTVPDSHTSCHDDGIIAAQAGLAVCLTCHKLQPLADDASSPPAHCRRCGERLHMRKPNSFSRTLALVLTAALLLFPANLLPIMRIDFLGISKSSTILDGIRLFMQSGSYFIGIIILVASVLVPLFKIIGLGILLAAIHWNQPLHLKQKTSMFRFIAFIGRWSMLDIFVIALLITLVDFGIFTTIHAAPAATFFCLVVATTMLAATTFDARIMWDCCCTHSQAEEPENLP